MRPSQALSLRVRVDLGVMTIKEYSTLTRTGALQPEAGQSPSQDTV